MLIQGRRQEVQSTGCKPQGKGFNNPTKFNCGLGEEGTSNSIQHQIMSALPQNIPDPWCLSPSPRDPREPLQAPSGFLSARGEWVTPLHPFFTPQQADFSTHTKQITSF